MLAGSLNISNVCSPIVGGTSHGVCRLLLSYIILTLLVTTRLTSSICVLNPYVCDVRVFDGIVHCLYYVIWIHPVTTAYSFTACVGPKLCLRFPRLDIHNPKFRMG